MYTFTRQITKTRSAEVVIVGGGVAGCAAAISAARTGAKVLLVEQSGCLGGQAGWGLVTPLSSTHSRDGIPFGGLVNEICGGVTKLARSYCVPETDTPGSLIASPHMLKYVLLRMCADSGVEVRFHTSLIGADVSGDKVGSVIVSEKSGFAAIEGKVFIDAGGDGDLLYFCRDSYSLGSEPDALDSLGESGLDRVHYTDDAKYAGYGQKKLMQPVSIFFSMGGVDYDRAASYNNKDLVYSDLGIDFDTYSKLPYAGKCGFEQDETQNLPLPQGRILVSRGVRRDVAVVNMSRVTGIDAGDPDSLNRGELLAQEQVVNLVDFLRRFVPGFEKSYYIESACSLGVREGRRLIGEYVLTGSDVINCRTFDDSVARGSYMIDIHDPQGKSRAVGGNIKGSFYEIPFRSLKSRNYSNLMAAGRCISADHVAHSSTRIQGTCILTGQAAGCAAALACKSGCEVKSLDASKLRDGLKSSGVWLG